MIEILAGLNSTKERLEQEADSILAGYFGSLRKLVDIVVNAEPRQATEEEMNDHKRYMNLVSDIIGTKRKMVVTRMMMQGKTKEEITSRFGYRPEYTFDGLLN